jgi:hypothetical protein
MISPRTQNTIAIKITNICSREKDLDKEPGLNHVVTDVQAQKPAIPNRAIYLNGHGIWIKTTA